MVQGNFRRLETLAVNLFQLPATLDKALGAVGVDELDITTGPNRGANTHDRTDIAVCHGAQLLSAAGVLEGRKCSAYPACQPEVERAGGTYVQSNESFSNAHTDGNLVTAPAWPAHPAWMRQFLDLLGTEIRV